MISCFLSSAQIIFSHLALLDNLCKSAACHNHALTALPVCVSLCLQPDELTNALEISNIVFTSLFSLEMLLKVLVYGPFGYIKNPYNIFDGIIVVIR